MVTCVHNYVYAHVHARVHLCIYMYVGVCAHVCVCTQNTEGSLRLGKNQQPSGPLDSRGLPITFAHAPMGSLYSYPPHLLPKSPFRPQLDVCLLEASLTTQGQSSKPQCSQGTGSPFVISLFLPTWGPSLATRAGDWPREVDQNPCHRSRLLKVYLSLQAGSAPQAR